MYRGLSLAGRDFCSIACRQVARRVSAELLLTVTCILQDGRVLRELHSDTEDDLIIKMQFYLLDLDNSACCPPAWTE